MIIRTYIPTRLVYIIFLLYGIQYTYTNVDYIDIEDRNENQIWRFKIDKCSQHYLSFFVSFTFFYGHFIVTQTYNVTKLYTGFPTLNFTVYFAVFQVQCFHDLVLNVCLV